MAFRIVFKKGDEEIGSTPCSDRTSAVERAMDHFPIIQRQNGATSVWVIDVETTPEMTIFIYTGTHNAAEA